MDKRNRIPRVIAQGGWLAAVLLLSSTAASAQLANLSETPDDSATTAAHAAPVATVAAPGTLGAMPGKPADSEQSLHLLVGRSLLISSPTKIKTLSLADPNIADAIVISPNQIMLNGKTPGGVSLVIWDEEGQSQTFEISVDIDILGLRQEIHDAFPKEPIQIDAAKDVVILSGKASSQEVADKVLEVVKGVTGKATSLIQVPPIQNGEVLLQVKFAEVNRSALSQLGINILSLPGAKTIGSITTQQFSAPIIQGQVGSIGGGAAAATTGASSAAFGLGNLLNIFLYNPQLNLAATIQALQSDNLLQILAEPNVLTESGKEGSFLAGGEFPFPVIQSSGGGTFPAITIQFKEFGIRLNFTPTITPDGLIHLKVKPEVSSLDFSNALTISGFTIPALSTRRVESEMDLKDGQSFAIAGLIDNQVTQQMTKMPGIGNIPILGNLFKSRQLQKSDDELLIVVTPRVVHPLEPANVPAGPVFPKSFMPPAKAEKKTGSN
jgi:pilus assembly protein CpaC